MAYDFLIDPARTGDDASFFPHQESGAATIDLEPADGTVASFPVAGIRVLREKGGRWVTVRDVSRVDARGFLTDARLAVVGASPSTNSLVAQARHAWPSRVGVVARRQPWSRNRLVAFLHDGTEGEESVLMVELSLPSGTDPRPLARDWAERAIRYRLRYVDLAPDDRAALEALSSFLPEPRAEGRGTPAYFRLPGTKKVLRSTAYPRADGLADG